MIYSYRSSKSGSSTSGNSLILYKGPTHLQASSSSLTTWLPSSFISTQRLSKSLSKVKKSKMAKSFEVSSYLSKLIFSMKTEIARFTSRLCQFRKTIPVLKKEASLIKSAKSKLTLYKVKTKTQTQRHRLQIMN